jgi:hypothetical protein
VSGGGLQKVYHWQASSALGHRPGQRNAAYAGPP